MFIDLYEGILEEFTAFYTINKYGRYTSDRKGISITIPRSVNVFFKKSPIKYSIEHPTELWRRQNLQFSKRKRTRQEIKDIRLASQNGESNRSIGKRFGIHHSQVDRIVKRKLYSDVP